MPAGFAGLATPQERQKWWRTRKAHATPRQPAVWFAESIRWFVGESREARNSQDKPQANIWQGSFPAFDGGNDGYPAQTAPVGCFPANGYGLYDMAGNVWEWTKDWYVPGLEPGSTSNPLGPNPQGSTDPGDPGVRKHVIKGGSYLCADNFCYRYRPAAREPGPPDTGAGHIGFRTVLRTK